MKLLEVSTNKVVQIIGEPTADPVRYRYVGTEKIMSMSLVDFCLNGWFVAQPEKANA